VSSRVQAVCDWFGPTDLLKMAEQSLPNSRIDHNAPDAPEARLIGGAVQENKEKARRANPITYVTKDDAPFLLIHGDQDATVPWQQSQILHEALTAAGVDSALIIEKGAEHGRGIGTPEHVRRIAEFFDKHLKARR
jgi:dipeptidyl aminopeptidase/acylaminoacyl peptidase